MNLLSKCAKFTAAFEGCHLTAYRCPAGVLTIGFGTTSGVKEGMKISQSQAIEWLERDLQVSYNAVQRLIKYPLSDNQLIALIDFTFNLGSGALQRSTLRSRLNRGDLHIENEFLKWNKVAGKVLRGLTIRRQAEANLWKQ